MSKSIKQKIREKWGNASLGRRFGSVLLGIVFAAISALVVEGLVSAGINDLAAFALVVTILWIGFLAIMRFLLWNDNLGQSSGY